MSSWWTRLLYGSSIVVGIAVSCVALLIVFIPDVERRVPIDAIVGLLGSDYLVVAVIGVFAIAAALASAAARSVHGTAEATPPIVEGVLSAPYPGETFDAMDGVPILPWRGGGSDAERRERIREAAIRATEFSSGCSRTLAEERVDTGDWTDDTAAVRYLSVQRGGGWRRLVPRRRNRFRTWFAPWRPVSHSRDLTRTVAEIDRLIRSGEEP